MARWSEKEIETLKNNYQIKTMIELMELLPNRSSNAIYLKASRLGFSVWDVKGPAVVRCRECGSPMAGFINTVTDHPLAGETGKICLECHTIIWDSEDLND